jgi:ABC-type lipoprotein export system ATPase subunit/CBS domain-containing protein
MKNNHLMTVSELCNKKVFTIKRFSTILHAAQLMRQYDTGELIVVEEEKKRIVPVGIVTDLDIIEKAVAENARLDAVIAEEIMNTEPVMAGEQDSISSTLQVMRDKNLRQIPVVDDKGSLVGTISMKSILDQQSKYYFIPEKIPISELKQKEKEKIKEREPEILSISELTIIGGAGKTGEKEAVDEVTIKMGDVVSIVGPTGSGKTMLINDIELFAHHDTPSQRKILINDIVPPEEFSLDPSKNPIALITQHTTFLSDLSVQKFLETHARIRKSGETESVIKETLDFANQLTGEAIDRESSMTELSGGQTRSLLIADAVVIGNSPIILLDEIENAGIHRTKALELLRKYEKIFIFVTHDLRIALLSDFRLVMKNGAIQKCIVTGEEEQRIAEKIKALDDLMAHFRGQLRAGQVLSERALKERLEKLGVSISSLPSYPSSHHDDEIVKEWRKNLWKW